MLRPRVLLAPTLATLALDEFRHHHTPMLEAFAAEAARLAADPPSLVIALSARWHSDGPFHVDIGARHRTLTDFGGFGVELRYDCPGHPTVARALVEAGERAGIRVGPAKRGVDSGVTVPLHFLLPARQVPVVPLSVADLAPEACRAWGAVVRRALDAREESVLFVAGGLLSADFHSWSFRREVPEATAFDEHTLELFEAGGWDRLREVDTATLERAHPDAELRHLDILRGLLGSDAPGEVLAYEPAPGIGAALVAFDAVSA
jgi:aromatic ring-opening dioxygenase catalytic subunit (LigB family)